MVWNRSGPVALLFYCSQPLVHCFYSLCKAPSLLHYPTDLALLSLSPSSAIPFSTDIWHKLSSHFYENICPLLVVQQPYLFSTFQILLVPLPISVKWTSIPHPRLQPKSEYLPRSFYFNSSPSQMIFELYLLFRRQPSPTLLPNFLHNPCWPKLEWRT